MNRPATLAACIGSMILGRAVRADFVEYRNEYDAWEALLTEQESIFFTGYPVGMLVTDQYAEQGIHFTDGLDIIEVGGLYRDLRGLSGWGNIEMAFDEPRTALAFDFIGVIKFRLFYVSSRLVAALIVAGSALCLLEQRVSFPIRIDSESLGDAIVRKGVPKCQPIFFRSINDQERQRPIYVPVAPNRRQRRPLIRCQIVDTDRKHVTEQLVHLSGCVIDVHQSRLECLQIACCCTSTLDQAFQRVAGLLGRIKRRIGAR